MGGKSRDHGGGLDAAVTRFGGQRADWLDLSTGINPSPYPLPNIPAHFWQDLPDKAAQHSLIDAARAFWHAPQDTDILAASGVSALIAQLPRLANASTAGINRPTYNEHEAAFRTFGWQISDKGAANIYVHPNNPDGKLFNPDLIRANHTELTIIDESFCDTCPDQTLVDLALIPGVVILKGLGKFWGLAGLRLGFAIALPDTINRLNDMLGPWAVSGPAQHIGAMALRNTAWANSTRTRLTQDAIRLDNLLTNAGISCLGGTDLFRLYSVNNATHFQNKLAKHHIWSRIFPYSDTMLRLGLPASDDDWKRLKQAVYGD